MSGVCPAELHDDAFKRLFALHDVQHMLKRERFKVQPVGRVIIRADRLRVAVDHHRLVARRAERLRRVDAAVIELDPLPDPVGTAAQHDHLLTGGGFGLALGFVGAVEVGCEGLEFGRARIHDVKGRENADLLAVVADVLLTNDAVCRGVLQYAPTLRR